MNAKSTVSTLALLAVVFAMVFFSGCSKDDGEDVHPAVGRYQLSSAVLVDDAPLPVPKEMTGTEEDVSFEAGDNVTALFSAVIANAGPCPNPAQTAIELSNDKKLAYVCLDDATLNAESGTWDVSGTSLTFIIVSETLGSVPLTVSNYKIENNKLSGRISNAPFPAKNEIGFQYVTMDIEFNKTN